MAEDRRDGSRLFWAAFVALSLALVLPMWLVTYPPGVDLPQHAAQITIGQSWWSSPLYREYYQLNPLSNDLLAHGVVFAFASVFSVVTALKITVSLALLAIPLVSLRLVRSVGGDRWWVFATFPVAYSYGFFWGFINYIAGVPLALLLISIAVDQVRQPTRRRLWALALVPLLVFLGHVLALAYAGIASAALIVFGLRGRDRWASLAALSVVVPVGCAWFIGVQLSAPSTTATPTIFAYGLGRLAELPGYVVGIPEDLTYLGLGLLAIVAPLLAGARPVAFGWRWIPAIACLALYLVVPLNILGTAFIYPRYAVFLVPALLVALRRGEPLRAGRALVVALALVSSVAMAFRFRAYEAESASFRDIVGEVEPGTRVLGLSYDVRSEAIPYPVYLHWVCWLQVERGVIADFSFAEFFPNRFRYRPEHDPDLPPHVEWAPRGFHWAVHGGAGYDYFLIRHRELMRPNPFAEATTHLELVAESPPWSLVRQRR